MSSSRKRQQLDTNILLHNDYAEDEDYDDDEGNECDDFNHIIWNHDTVASDALDVDHEQDENEVAVPSTGIIWYQDVIDGRQKVIHPMIDENIITKYYNAALQSHYSDRAVLPNPQHLRDMENDQCETTAKMIEDNHHSIKNIKNSIAIKVNDQNCTSSSWEPQELVLPMWAIILASHQQQQQQQQQEEDQ